MKKIITITLISLPMLFSSNILAEGFNDNYFEVGYSTNNFKVFYNSSYWKTKCKASKTLKSEEESTESASID